MRIRHIGVLLTALLAPFAVPSAAYAAKPPPPEHYSGTFPEAGEPAAVFNDCGFDIDFRTTFSGLFKVREVKGSDGQAYLGHDVFRFVDTLTNVKTGESFQIEGAGTFKEKTGLLLPGYTPPSDYVDDNGDPIPVVGPVYEFTAQEVARFTVLDSAGQVVLRDRGRITLSVVFDTLGDGAPGGRVIEGPEVTSVAGPHPFGDADFCDVASSLIGPDA